MMSKVHETEKKETRIRTSIIILVIAVIAVITVYVVRYINNPVKTTEAIVVEHEKSFSGEAYFIRRETVYTAQTTGTFYTHATEGSRVGKDRLLATVYNGIVDDRQLQELSNIDRKIEELEDFKKESSFQIDKSDKENLLKNFRGSILEAVRSGDLSDIPRIKNYMKSIISDAEIPDMDNEIASLRENKLSIERSITSSKRDIFSDCSGIFSANIDGMENILTADKINEYSLSDFDSIEYEPINAEKRITANSGDEVCKVIDNHTWYVMAKLPFSEVEELKEGDSVVLRFGAVPGVEPSAKIAHISEDGSGFVVVVFESDKYIEGIFSIRKSDITVVLEQYRGYKIPVHAVRVKDGQQGVMVKYGLNEIFKPCEIIYTDTENDWVIIEPVTKDVRNPLEQFDKIILGEKVEPDA